MATLSIAKQFPEYRFPGPHVRTLGANSGQQFREECFMPWLLEHWNDEQLILDIGGLVAYPPSFFKGLFAVEPHHQEKLKLLKIKCENTCFQTKIEHLLNFSFSA